MADTVAMHRACGGSTDEPTVITALSRAGFLAAQIIEELPDVLQAVGLKEVEHG
jgi:hypothetical protein